MAPTKAIPDSVVALESFIGSVDGEDRVFRVGDLVRVTDPAVKKWPHLFGEAGYAYERPVEQATRAPGEKRGA